MDIIIAVVLISGIWSINENVFHVVAYYKLYSVYIYLSNLSHYAIFV